MPQLKVGIHLPSLRVPLPQALAIAGRLGADAVEIDARFSLKPSELSQTALRQLRKSLDDQRLRVCAVSYRTRRGYNVAEELDARVAGTMQAMRMAHALGASVVVNHVGHIPVESHHSQWSMLVEVLADLGRHGQHVGAMLAAQTGGGSPDDLAKLIASLPEGSLAVDLDAGALVVDGYNPQDAVARLGNHIMHVHATDGVRDAAKGRGAEVPLGRGSVDYPALLAALDQRGYRGYFTIERRDAANPALEISQAVQFLRNL